MVHTHDLFGATTFVCQQRQSHCVEISITIQERRFTRVELRWLWGQVWLVGECRKSLTSSAFIGNHVQVSVPAVVSSYSVQCRFECMSGISRGRDRSIANHMHQVNIRVLPTSVVATSLLSAFLTILDCTTSLSHTAWLKGRQYRR